MDTRYVLCRYDAFHGRDLHARMVETWRFQPDQDQSINQTFAVTLALAWYGSNKGEIYNSVYYKEIIVTVRVTLCYLTAL
jgi:hypothetical protein